MNSARNSEKTGALNCDYLIPGFIHRIGVHCTSSAIRNVFEFHGVKMSEALLFGMGSGLGLGYLKIWGSEPFFGGRSKDFIKNLCSALGIKFTEWRSKNAEEGWQRLKGYLENNIPCAIDIDMHYLNYQELHDPDFHFGAHAIVVCGYNAERKTVLVTDTAFPDIKEISLEKLTEGRNSTHDKFMAPRNLIYEFEFPGTVPELATVIEGVLHTTGMGLKATSGRVMRAMGIHGGINALDVFAKDLEKWLKLPADRLAARASLQAGYISSYGTGGGLFRYLFAGFLEEVATKIGDASLSELGSYYRDLGDHWEELASLFTKLGSIASRDQNELIMKEIKGRILTIKTLELEGADKLVDYRRE
ncbi:MAG: BtrH N-terminal domain-containing protein [Candidatus Odinarchaeota archaeon]